MVTGGCDDRNLKGDRGYATATESLSPLHNGAATNRNLNAITKDPWSFYASTKKNHETDKQEWHRVHKNGEEGLAGGNVNIGPDSEGGHDQRPPSQQDVFNYAARFNLVPTIKVYDKGSFFVQTPYITVIIGLAEQNIKAVGSGASFSAAQSQALLNFKNQANDYCERIDSALSSMSCTFLTTKNALQFIKFYELYYDARIRRTVDYSDAFGKSNQLFEACVFLNDKPLCSPVMGIGKQSTYLCAGLAAGTNLLNQQPNLWPSFLEELKKGSGRIMRPVDEVKLSLREDCLYSMRDTIQDVRAAGLPDFIVPERDTSVITEYRKRHVPKSKGLAASKRSMDLKTAMRRARKNPVVAKIRAVTSELPANHYRNELIDMINGNVFSVVAADTGSGKTTQVPQILFDHAIENDSGAKCNIMVTQPRRIAATSVAQRVAAERNRAIGDTVGYHIRFDCKAPQLTGGITFSTTGVLLTLLRFSAEEIFDNVSHIIVDEVHERSLDVDFLMINLKRTVEARLKAKKRVPRIVFMSATLDVDLFVNYFRNMTTTGDLAPCPNMYIPGRVYPVEKHFLGDLFHTFAEKYDPSSFRSLFEEKMTTTYLRREELRSANEKKLSYRQENGKGDVAAINWDSLDDPLIEFRENSLSHQLEDHLVPIGLAAATVAHISKTSGDGAILVFLPGFDSIESLELLLRTKYPLGVDFNDETKFKIIKLHSAVPVAQTEVFDQSPQGCRKIILSTNIAETSVTIPDIRHVVDTGKVNEPLYDSFRRISKLACCWVSKSSSQQRAGRAGRVQDGKYYALFSKERFDSFRAVGVPEILRLDLQEVCLEVKTGSFSSNIREFLNEAIEPPPATQVDASVQNLQELEALDENETITPLGRLLANIPLHPSLGKMIILGIIFRCLEPMIILGVCTGERDLFYRGDKDSRPRIRQMSAEYAGSSNSDHIAVLNAIQEMRNVQKRGGWSALVDFARTHDLRFSVYRNITKTAAQIEFILADKGLIPNPRSNSSPLPPFGGSQMNKNSENQELVKALLLSGLFPNLAVKNSITTNGWQTCREAAAIINSDSVNYTRILKSAVKSRGTLLTFSSLKEPIDGNILILVQTSEISPLLACLFGGRLTGKGSILRMDDWLPFRVEREEVKGDTSYAVRVVVEFRKCLDRVCVLCLLLLQPQNTFCNVYEKKTNVMWWSVL